MKLSLGFSPCPNDTFIFDALVNQKIDTGGLEFDTRLADVETLNQWSFEDKLDITKLSFPAFFQNTDKYRLLHAGSALGKGAGPLLISKQDFELKEITGRHIAIPGMNTTANLLLHFAYPDATRKTAMLFSEIEDAVLSGKTELGLIIHENRFTYQEKGLKKISDLGAIWETKMNVPVPLGGIAIRRSVSPDLALQVQSLIRQSIDYAQNKYPVITDYVKQHAREMNEDVMKQHIELYVNEFSADLGPVGQKAIETLYTVFLRIEKYPPIPHSSSQLFLS